MRNIRWRAGEECERDGGEDDKKAEKYIIQDDGRDRDRDSNDAERPKPISATLDMFVLVCAPAEGGHGYNCSIARRRLT